MNAGLSTFRRLTATLLLLLTTGAALAAAEVPAIHIGVASVSARQAKALVDRGVAVVDVRSQHDFLDGHIPGAFHAVYRERSMQRPDFDPTQDGVQAFLDRLHRKVPNPGTEIIIYCNGIHCWKSFKALRAAADRGYRKLYWLRGGLAEWQKEGLPVTKE